MNNNEKRGTLDLSLLNVVCYFKEGDELVPFTPLIKTYDPMMQKWFWVGFRLDKSDNVRNFLVDVCRSIDKRDLKLYENYIFNDILVEVPVDYTVKGDWLVAARYPTTYETSLSGEK